MASSVSTSREMQVKRMQARSRSAAARPAQRLIRRNPAIHGTVRLVQYRSRLDGLPHLLAVIRARPIGTERDAFQDNKSIRPQQPVRRVGKPEEVAELAVYLSSEQAAFITGQCYLVNGGMYYL